jgi:hypothetical protein
MSATTDFPDHGHDRLRSLLKTLPRIDAKPDFEARLFSRMGKEGASRSKRRWLGFPASFHIPEYALSFIFLIVAGFYFVYVAQRISTRMAPQEDGADAVQPSSPAQQPQVVTQSVPRLQAPPTAAGRPEARNSPHQQSAAEGRFAKAQHEAQDTFPAEQPFYDQSGDGFQTVSQSNGGQAFKTMSAPQRYGPFGPRREIMIQSAKPAAAGDSARADSLKKARALEDSAHSAGK